MAIATLSEKYQISIPKEIREKLGLAAGRKVTFHQKDGLVYMMRIPTLDELRGSMKGANTDNIRDRTDRLERYKDIKPAKPLKKAA
jgi:AbrB family looped-hinge helix DNA binding protein